MSRYFLDTEFLEGKQKDNVKKNLSITIAILYFTISIILVKDANTMAIIVSVCLFLLASLFFIVSKYAKTPNTIDLISIGIVSEDNREFYEVSKDFNLKEAWNRYQLDQVYGDMRNKYPEGVRNYWIRNNVLKPIFDDFIKLEVKYINKQKRILGYAPELNNNFTYKNFKRLLEKYGKSNEEIAELIAGNNNPISFIKRNGQVGFDGSDIEFYAYYADYDWVVFCWLFGRMIDLPNGFPKYCNDLKQMSDEIYFSKKQEYTRLGGRNFINKMSNHLDYPKQTNEHNALADAKWNKELHEFLKTIL